MKNLVLSETLFSVTKESMELMDQARAVAKALETFFGKRLVSIVLFGSVARGKATPHSDIDLLLVLKDLPAGRLARRMLLDPFFEKGGRWDAINCHLRTPAEAAKISLFYYDFPSDAKVLYDTDDFMAGIIQKVADHIRKSGAVRRPWGKFYYWDLKPGAHADETFKIL